MYEYDFPGISNDCNGLTTSEIAPCVYFLRDGDKRSAACYVHNDASKFPVTTMVLQHQRLHDTFTFLVTEKVLAFSDFLKCMNMIFRDFK